MAWSLAHPSAITPSMLSSRFPKAGFNFFSYHSSRRCPPSGCRLFSNSIPSRISIRQITLVYCGSPACFRNQEATRQSQRCPLRASDNTFVSSNHCFITNQLPAASPPSEATPMAAPLRTHSPVNPASSEPLPVPPALDQANENTPSPKHSSIPRAPLPRSALAGNFPHQAIPLSS